MRSSNETYTDAAGNLSYVGSNVLALGLAGLQIWEGRTNIFLQSADLSNGSWLTFLSGSGALTITGNSGLAPDGSMTAAKIVASRSVVTDAAQRYQVFTGTAAPYTGSFYIQAFSGADVGKTISLQTYNGTTVTLQLFTLTSAWQRISLARTMAASSSCNFGVGLSANDGGSTGTVNFLIWGGQNELGAFVSPYIPTTTATAARAADNITATGTLATALSSSAQTIAFYSNGSQQSLAGTLVDSNGTVTLGKASGNALTTALGAALSTGNTGIWTGVTKGYLGFDPSGGAINLNNGMSATDATARTTASPFHVGSTSGSSAFLDGNLTRFTVFGSKVSPVLP